MRKDALYNLKTYVRTKTKLKLKLKLKRFIFYYAYNATEIADQRRKHDAVN